MRRPWASNEFSVRGRPHSNSTRVLAKDLVPCFYLKNSANFESVRTLPRPVTAGSCWATSRVLSQQPSSEVEGMSTEEVKLIYRAKCKDLDIIHIKDQEQRFITFCSKSFINRTIGLNENGLGVQGVRVLSNILKKNLNFCRLNLSKNNIREEGVVLLANSLKKNKVIVSVDVSSNDISPEGLSKFFNVLRTNDSLVSINISSLDGLHRNRLGVKGAEAVSEYLKENRILSHLNLSDTGIGREGLEHLTQGLAYNEVIVFLDISFNGLTAAGLEYFCEIILTTNLQELNLSGNKIGNKGCEFLAKTLASKVNKVCLLVKLDIAYCEITSAGVQKICESLENNAHVTHLLIDGNNLSQFSGPPLSKFISLNTTLQFLSLNNCSLKDENAIKVFEGLSKNNGVRKISLSKNQISDESAQILAETIKKTSTLAHLDLSYNLLKDKGGVKLATALKFNSSLESLNFTENSLKDETGRILAEVTRFKGNLLKIDLTMNPMNLKYTKEIKENLTRNLFKYKQLLTPKIRKKIEGLALKENDIECVEQQIEGKKIEAEEFKEKIEKLKLKFGLTQTEEKEKNNVVRFEFNEVKEMSQSLSAAIEGVHLDNYKNRVAFEKMKEEVSLQIAFVSQDILKLEKKKALAREEFGMKRAVLSNKIMQVKDEFRACEMNYQSDVNTIKLMRQKIRDMTAEIEKIKNPEKWVEEKKKSASPRRKRSAKKKRKVVRA